MSTKEIINKEALADGINNYQITEAQAITKIMNAAKEVVKDIDTVNKTTNDLLNNTIKVDRLNQVEFLMLMSHMTGTDFNLYLKSLQEDGYVLDEGDKNLINKILLNIEDKDEVELELTPEDFEIVGIMQNEMVKEMVENIDLSTAPEYVTITFNDFGTFTYKLLPNNSKEINNTVVNSEVIKLEPNTIIDITALIPQPTTQPTTLEAEELHIDELLNIEELSVEELHIEELSVEELEQEELETEELPIEELNAEELEQEELPVEELEQEELSIEELNAEELSVEELNAEELNTEDLVTEDIPTENFEFDVSNIIQKLENSLGTIEEEDTPLTKNDGKGITQYKTYNIFDNDKGVNDQNII